MVLRKIKVGKIATVIFLTILIWVWQDLALDDEFEIPNATINIANPPANLWVSFNNKRSISIDNIVLKGPASKISETTRKWNSGLLEFDFSLNPEREGMTTAGPRTLTVLDFVKRSDKMKELPGLTVQSCEPRIVDVNVVELDEKALAIECVNEDGVLVEVESIEPAKIVMYVPPDSRLTAKVKLSRREIELARVAPLKKIPYVVLAADQRRQASTNVEVKMSSEVSSLSEFSIDTAKLGIVLSGNLIGKYKPDVTNRNSLVNPLNFNILATLEAKQAYENKPCQIFLYILDIDTQKGPEEVQRREVVYNFPEEYVRRDEIKLKDPKQQIPVARFKLISLTPAEAPTARVD